LHRALQNALYVVNVSVQILLESMKKVTSLA